MSECEAAGAVFVVRFGCRNCGNEWTHELPARTEARTVGAGPVGDAKVISTDCEQFSSQCDCCWYVVCPVCELRDHVTIDDREPLDDDGGQDK